jgi:hypothetical protein
MKPKLWLLISDIDRPDLHLVAPAVAWIAAEAGAHCETYFEAKRDGRLFARHGSMVIGGMHHQQFNYLHATFDVHAILWGETSLWNSSLARFETPVLAQTGDIASLYSALLDHVPQALNPPVIFLPTRFTQTLQGNLELGPYFFPEIHFRKALAFPPALASHAARFSQQALTLGLAPEEQAEVRACFESVTQIDTIREEDDFGSVTMRIADRWRAHAKGVAFGDPPAILSQLADHCRHRRLPVFAPKVQGNPCDVIVSSYTVETSSVAVETAKLAVDLGNPVIVGRQTGDGDIFEWSRHGVCIQIIDPNRPPFPVVQEVPQRWDSAHSLPEEPSDSELIAYAESGKRLATLLWHSGEVAHNEAMLNVMELAAFTGLKMGIGVHAARYETCPQLWELLAVPQSGGGMRGLIEPVLHSGGMGVLAECNCPPALLREHCVNALARIRDIAGEAGMPRGYYAFMDSDLATLSSIRRDIFAAIEDAGLEFMVSSAVPGRNRMLHQTGKMVTLNQSCRVVHGASPFVRITTVEDIETACSPSPGWMIATLDAPVISFAPYIWRYGSRFMRMVDYLLSDRWVNVTPNTVARYARILSERNYLGNEL